MTSKLTKILLLFAILAIGMIQATMVANKVQSQSKALTVKAQLKQFTGGFCWHPCYCWRPGPGFGASPKVCWCWYPCFCWWRGPRFSTATFSRAAAAEGERAEDVPSSMPAPSTNPPSTTPSI